MPRGVSRHALLPHRRYDFSGGLNLAKGRYALADNEMRICRNWVLDEQGALVKRSGLARFNQSEIPGLLDGP